MKARFFPAFWLLGLVTIQPAGAFDGCLAADVNEDGIVDQLDVDEIGEWIGLPSPRLNLDGDEVVTEADRIIVERYQEIELDFPPGLRALLCPPCPADFDCNGSVDVADRSRVEEAQGRDCRPDLNRDGVICPRDIRLLEAYLGSTPPLSRAAERADIDGDGDVDLEDRLALLILLAEPIDQRDCRLDLNRDGAVDAGDLPMLHTSWGSCGQTCPSAAVVGPPTLDGTCDEGKPREEGPPPGAFAPGLSGRPAGS